MPVVTVVIATYNYAHFLPDAVRSIQAQTFSDWECVIVDDASTDNTGEIAAEMVRIDGRIRYLRNATNAGEAGTRNAGNKAANGEYIAVLDADDWWHPQKLELQLTAIRAAEGAVMSFTGAAIVAADPRPDFFCETSWLEGLPGSLRLDNQIVHSSVLVAKSAVEAAGGYDESLPYAVDWDLWLRIIDLYGQHALIYINEPLLFYRMHAGNMSHNWRRNLVGERAVLRKALFRNMWAARHPLATWNVVDRQLERELGRYETAGLAKNAFRCACCWIALFPLKRWRWRRAFNRVQGSASRRAV